jgi:hypothetical protein
VNLVHPIEVDLTPTSPSTASSPSGGVIAGLRSSYGSPLICSADVCGVVTGHSSPLQFAGLDTYFAARAAMMRR